MAQAVQDAGKIGKVFTVGLGTPQSMKPYLADGSSSAAILWNVENLGYLTAWAGAQLAQDKPFEPTPTTSATASRRRVRRGDQDAAARAAAGDHQGQRRPVQLLMPWHRRRGSTPAGPPPDERSDHATDARSPGAASRRRARRGIPAAVTGISKSFGAVRAIRSAEISIQAGRVHALVGENGAGKSTMIKILSGVEQADTGTIEFDGAPVTIARTADAIALGIATVYQEPQLFPELTVSENIFTGREIRKGGRVAWAAQNAKVVELLELLGLPAALRHGAGRRAVHRRAAAGVDREVAGRATPRCSSSTSRPRSSPTPRSTCCSRWSAG